MGSRGQRMLELVHKQGGTEKCDSDLKAVIKETQHSEANLEIPNENHNTVSSSSSSSSGETEKNNTKLNAVFSGMQNAEGNTGVGNETDYVSCGTSSVIEPVITQKNCSDQEKIYIYELVGDQLQHQEAVENINNNNLIIICGTNNNDETQNDNNDNLYYSPPAKNDSYVLESISADTEVVIEELTNVNCNELAVQHSIVPEEMDSNNANSSTNSDDVSEYDPNDPDLESNTSSPNSSTEPIDYSQMEAHNSDLSVNSTTQNEQSSLRRKREYKQRQENTKKRQRNPSTWKMNIQKAKIRSGRAYINKSGNVVKAKELEPGCSDTCRRKCKSKFTEEQRLAVFTKFWNMGNYNRQSSFVGAWVRRIPKKRMTVKENNEPSRKSSSLSYTLPKNALEKVQVCKKMFLNSLDITDMWVMTALKKMDNAATGTVTPDKRGTHSNRTCKIPEAVKRTVREHIELFPKVPSHYCRERTNKLYVEDGLTIATMYRLYKTWAEENDNVVTATERQYRDIFNNEFNIGFHKPKKDMCDICNLFEMAEEKTEDKIEKQNKHLARKERVRTQKEEDKNEAKTDKNLCVSCFDLQKVIQVPQSTNSAFYYKCKLSVFNFTIFDLANKEAFCQIWHEAIGKRGANEISSCLYLYLIQMIRQGKKRFIFYSDNCIGQNKNKVLVSMYSYVAKRYEISIVHRFLEQGHTQNENDSVHALIERKKRHVDLFTPDQFIMLVKMAKAQGKPYNVNELGQDNIFDFKKISNSFKNFTKNTNGDKVIWNNITEIIVKTDNSELVSYKYELDQEPYFMNLNQAKKTRMSTSLTKDDNVLRKSYDSSLPLPKKKYEHLQFLKNKLPVTYRYFYESLSCNNEEGSDVESE